MMNTLFTRDKQFICDITMYHLHHIFSRKNQIFKNLIKIVIKHY